jgi:hypothetical protein
MGSIAVLLTSCSTGLDLSVLQIQTKIVSCHTADSKPVKQEVDITVILSPLIFPGFCLLGSLTLKTLQLKAKTFFFFVEVHCHFIFRAIGYFNESDTFESSSMLIYSQLDRFIYTQLG